MGKGKATRLSKAAREFNVGISTIVEFLNKKGFNIDTNPNTKISEELYNILIKEYSSDIDVKKESEKLSLEQLRSKKETLTLEKETKTEEKTAEPVVEQEVIIKDVSSSNTFTSEEKPKADIKVVGKIDLNPKKQEPELAEEKPKKKKQGTSQKRPRKNLRVSIWMMTCKRRNHVK